MVVTLLVRYFIKTKSYTFVKYFRIRYKKNKNEILKLIYYKKFSCDRCKLVNK
jgi:hypothetical protein